CGHRLPHRHGPEHTLAVRRLLDRARARRRRRRHLRRQRPEGGAPVKAVVMAGGEGTRLRPLTSNQPKPMVPIVGKPCMEHILEPEVLRHVPTDRPFDFSKELFPLLLEMGRPMYGFVMDGYWQDIGNLDQFRQANLDALEQRVQLDITGIRIRGNVWLGEGVEVDDLDQIEGPAYIGNYCRIAPS